MRGGDLDILETIMDRIAKNSFERRHIARASYPYKTQHLEKIFCQNLLHIFWAEAYSQSNKAAITKGGTEYKLPESFHLTFSKPRL